MSSTIITDNSEQLLNQKNISKPIDWLKTGLVTLTASLLIVTGTIQNSCYPMVTTGNLNKVCRNRLTEVVRDSKTHGSVLIKWAENPDLNSVELREIADNLDRPKVSVDLSKIRQDLAYNPHTPADILSQLTASEDPMVIAKIASREDANNDTFQKVIEHPVFKDSNKSFYVRMALANNPKTPLSILHYVANASNEIDIKKQLAQNRQLSEDVLQKLAQTENFELLQLVIKNANTSTKVLDLVGENHVTWNSENSYIQQLLAKQKKISTKLADRLALESKEPSVLHSLLDNSSNNITPEIRDKVTERLGTKQESQTFSSPENKNGIATSNPTNCKNRHLINNGAGALSGLATTLLAIGIIDPVVIPLEIPIFLGMGAYSLITSALELFHHC